MQRLLVVALLGGLTVSACSTTPITPTTAMPAASVEPAPRPQVGGGLPANSELVLSLDTRLSSKDSKVGDIFTAVVNEDVTAVNGEVILPAGTIVTGIVTGVDDSERAGDAAAIRLNFLRINVDKAYHPFTADIVSTHLETAHDPTAADVVAATGAVLGAVLQKDVQDVLLGDALRRGAGTVIALGSGEVEPVLPAGTRLVVRTRDLLELR